MNPANDLDASAATGEALAGGSNGSMPQSSLPATSTSLGLSFPNGANVSNVATDWLDAANKRVPTLKLNARRKFFHALAVVMFVPGVALDVGIFL